MKKFIPSIVLLSVASLSGCSAFVSKTEMVSATCSEEDARLQINSHHFKGSGQVAVKKGRRIAITCLKSGYFPAQKTIDYSLSGTGVADIVGTVVFLVPGIGLFTDGAWQLDETSVQIPMMRNEK